MSIRCAPDAVRLGHPVAGADQPVGRRLEALAGAARGEDHVLGRERLQRCRCGCRARLRRRTWPCVVEDQRGREPLLVGVHAVGVLHQLLVEHVQDRLAGDVGDVGGALHRGAAERAQVEVAGRVAVERDADVLEVQDLGRRLRAHDLDRVLVAEVVGALDGVERVRAPVVVGVDRGVDPARRGDRMRAHRMDLAHDRDTGAGVGRGQRGALTGKTRADDQDVVLGHRL